MPLITGEHITSVYTSSSNETQNGFNNMLDTFLVVISVIPCLLTKHRDKGSLWYQSKKRQAALYESNHTREKNNIVIGEDPAVTQHQLYYRLQRAGGRC